MKFIENLANYNITVFEFIETHNKRENANINGFFLAPNIIVLKRIQKSIKREIFTLAHEFGHYLLNIEEIDDISEDYLHQTSLSRIEKWCNDFAWYFLAGDYADIIENLDNASIQNNFQDDIVTEISKNTALSSIAIYTRLVISNKISQNNYTDVCNRIFEAIQERENQKRLKIEQDKAQGIISQARPPKPIISPLVVKTLQSAFYEGIIGESEFCKRLHINPDKIERYLI